MMKKRYFILLFIWCSLWSNETLASQNLKSILNFALVKDPTLYEARAEHQGAYNAMKSSEGEHYPIVSVVGKNVLAQKHRGDGRTEENDVGLRMQLNLYAWGGIQAAVERDKYKMSYFRHKYDETREELANKISELYFVALSAKESLQVAREDIKRHKKFMADLSVISQYDEGRSSEMAQAQSRYLQAQAREAEYDKKLALALSQINKYTHTHSRITVEDIIDPFIKETSLNLISLYDKYPASQHPSVLAQESEAKSAQANVDATQVAKYPRINLEASATRRDRAVNLTMSWDLFDQRTSYSHEQNRSKVLSAQARSAQVIRDVEERAATAKVAMAQSERRAKIANSLISTQKQVASNYSEQFYISKRSLLEVLDSYTELANTEYNYVQAKNDFREAALSYMLAKGALAKWAGVPDFNFKN